MKKSELVQLIKEVISETNKYYHVFWTDDNDDEIQVIDNNALVKANSVSEAKALIKSKCFTDKTSIYKFQNVEVAKPEDEQFAEYFKSKKIMNALNSRGYYIYDSGS
jgi:hypothetical protein